MAEWDGTISVEEIIDKKASIRGEIKWVRMDLASGRKAIKELKRKEARLLGDLARLELRRRKLVNG